jgi:hypothetical protein
MFCGSLLFPPSFASSPIGDFWNHLPNKILASTSLVSGLISQVPNLRQVRDENGKNLQYEESRSCPAGRMVGKGREECQAPPPLGI